MDVDMPLVLVLSPKNLQVNISLAFCGFQPYLTTTYQRSFVGCTLNKMCWHLHKAIIKAVLFIGYPRVHDGKPYVYSVNCISVNCIFVQRNWNYIFTHMMYNLYHLNNVGSGILVYVIFLHQEYLTMYKSFYNYT